MLGLKEFAKKSGLSYNGVRRMALAGEIPCIRIGNRYKFAENALEVAAATQTARRQSKVEVRKEKTKEYSKYSRTKNFDFETFRKNVMHQVIERYSL